MSHDVNEAGCAVCGDKVWLECGTVEEHADGECVASEAPLETVEECAKCGGTGTIGDHRPGHNPATCGCIQCGPCAGTGYIAHAYPKEP